MLHPGLNPLKYQAELQSRRRMQIRPLLQERAAEALSQCLREQVPWTLAYRRDDESKTLPHEEYAALDEAQRRQLLHELGANARGRYGFAYDSYMMVGAYNQGRDPGLILHRVLEYLNSDEFLYFARTLTGLPQIRRVSAQTTRFRPGHFLRNHNDVSHEEGRLAAYVMNLTARWNPDWGGLLQFFGADGGVEETLVPRYNSLSVFLVPSDHAVSLVAPYAEEDRLAITGWFQT